MPRVRETESRRALLGRPKVFLYSWRLQEGKLAHRLFPPKKSVAQGVGWSSQHDPTRHFSSVYWALTVPAREEGDLTGDPLLPCCSSFSQTFKNGARRARLGPSRAPTNRGRVLRYVTPVRSNNYLS